MNVFLVASMMLGLFGLIIISIIITTRIMKANPVTCESTCPTPQICGEVGCAQEYMDSQEESIPSRKLTPHIEQVLKKEKPKKKTEVKKDEIVIKKTRSRRNKNL